MTAQCYPRRLPILRKGRPARRTNLAPRLRSEGVSEDISPVMRKPHVAHDTSASKGLPCSEVQHLPPDHRRFLRRVARASLRHSSCWLSCAFPRQPRGSRKGHVLLHPKRSFPNSLQTLHTCSADCHQAEDRGRVTKKPCEPKCVNTDRKQQIHPHSIPNIPAPSPEQPLDF